MAEQRTDEPDKTRSPGRGHCVVTAHRGCSGELPENTMAAFERAIELGADYLETDVRLTADGRLVCIHDSTVDRTTDGAGEVSGLTLSQIRSLDAGEGQRIPLLEEVLELASNRIGVQIELKCAGSSEALVKLLQHRAADQELRVISFFDDWLRAPRSSGLRTGVLAAEWDDGIPIRVAEMDACLVGLQYRSISAAVVRSAARVGIELHAWTANRSSEIRSLLNMGVNGITSDYPDRVLQQRTLRDEGLRQFER